MKEKVVVELKQVTKKVKNKTLVENISFQINAGEVFGFLGENGAGKTTTIKMIVGLSRITQGDIFINGYSIRKDFSKAIRNIGAIVENPDLYQYMTGYQNLKHFANMLSGIDDSRIYEVAKMMGIEGHLQKKVRNYSLGLRQRLGLAQALLHNPSLLILDEPTNGLDPKGINEFREKLKHLAHDKGIAVLVSSHLLSEMQLLCDRVGIIQTGKMVTVKKMEELLEENSTVVCLKVNKMVLDKAIALIKEVNREILSIDDDRIYLNMNEAEIPTFNKLLVEKDIFIYGIEIRKESLENYFLKVEDKND